MLLRVIRATTREVECETFYVEGINPAAGEHEKSPQVIHSQALKVKLSGISRFQNGRTRPFHQVSFQYAKTRT